MSERSSVVSTITPYPAKAVLSVIWQSPTSMSSITQIEAVALLTDEQAEEVGLTRRVLGGGAESLMVKVSELDGCIDALTVIRDELHDRGMNTGEAARPGTAELLSLLRDAEARARDAEERA